MRPEYKIPDTSNFTAKDTLEWAWNEFGQDAVFTSSFGAEDMVIMDLINKSKLNLKVSTIDTGRLHDSTYELIDAVRDHYGIRIRTYFPGYSNVEEMVESGGHNLFYKSPENRKLCCNIRKVQPLNRLLDGKKAWITGLRADQTDFRKNSGMISVDKTRELLKVNPLINWTSQEVWKYIKDNEVPYNRLHDQGFPSIGCAPCTRAVRQVEDERAGRWWWESEMKECGLHVENGSDRIEIHIPLEKEDGV